MSSELLMIAIGVSVTYLLLALRSFIFRGDTKGHSYQVWIVNLGDDDPGNDPSALEDWPAEIEVPADLFIDTKAKAACLGTVAAGRAGLN